MNRLSGHTYRLFIFLFAFLLFLTGCDQSPEVEESSRSGASETSVAFVYKEEIADYNWSHLHELGRQYVVENVSDIETKYVEGVAIEDAEQVIRDLADEGHKLIFATAPEFSDTVLLVAKDFPDTFFEVAQGSETADNVGTYDGRMYQMFYMVGRFAAEMTLSGVIGFVAPEPTVEVIRHINAIALSALSHRPCEDVTVQVRWTGSWNDPEADRTAALDLVEAGADILVQHTYSPEVQKVAEEKGVRSVGYGFDMREFAPTAITTSIIWQWGWYYERQVNALLEGEWEAEAYFGKASTKNFGRGIIDLAPFDYEQIPTIIAAMAMRLRVQYNETNRDALDGPINAQNGDLVLAKGDKFDQDYLLNEMDWFVVGVVGEAPGEPPEAVEGIGALINC